MLSSNSIKAQAAATLHRRKKKPKLPPTHTYLHKCVAKISAYARVGKQKEVNEWSQLLIAHLQKEFIK